MTFVDESIETVDDGFFAVNWANEPSAWQNSPTVRHGQSGVFAFADGHAERWRWRVLNQDQDLDAPYCRPAEYVAGFTADAASCPAQFHNWNVRRSDPTLQPARPITQASQPRNLNKNSSQERTDPQRK